MINRNRPYTWGKVQQSWFIHSISGWGSCNQFVSHHIHGKRSSWYLKGQNFHHIGVSSPFWRLFLLCQGGNPHSSGWNSFSEARTAVAPGWLGPPSTTITTWRDLSSICHQERIITCMPASSPASTPAKLSSITRQFSGEAGGGSNLCKVVGEQMRQFGLAVTMNTTMMMTTAMATTTTTTTAAATATATWKT